MSTNPNISSPAHARALSIEDLAVRSGITSEHVILSGDESAAPEPRRSNAVRQRIRLYNRATRAETVIRIFRDGYLSASEQRRGRKSRERTVDLRFVDPSPRLSRSVAKTPLQVGLGCLAASTLGGALGYFSILPSICWTIAAISAAAAVPSMGLYVRRTRERIEFRTVHGRAVVLTLVANIGSLRAHRRAIPKLVAAIRAADRLNASEKQMRLREEMREHYRLLQAGLISDEACTAATRRILERF